MNKHLLLLSTLFAAGAAAQAGTLGAKAFQPAQPGLEEAGCGANKTEAKGEKQAKEGERVLHTERYASSYVRSFELPTEVTQETAEAAFENGVLRLGLPKRVQVAGKRLAIH